MKIFRVVHPLTELVRGRLLLFCDSKIYTWITNFVFKLILNNYYKL